MERFRGTITRGTEAWNVEGVLTVSQDIRGGLEDWRGAFKDPGGTSLSPGQEWKLTLKEGRCGRVVLKRLNANSDGLARWEFERAGD